MANNWQHVSRVRQYENVEAHLEDGNKAESYTRFSAAEYCSMNRMARHQGQGLTIVTIL